MSGILGFIGQGLSSVFENSFMEEDRNQQQMFSSSEAQKNREFQAEMSRTAYQRAMWDMNQAGLNPMLVTHNGGASTPSGAAASSAPGRAPRVDLGGGVVSAAQIEKIEAENKVLAATEERTRAETREIEARTPTHAWSIERIKQEINESVERINKIMAEVNATRQSERTSAADEFRIQQQTRNLREQVPQIRAIIDNLKAQTRREVATTGKLDAETGEIDQRVKANLPEIERLVKDLEAKARNLEMPRRGMDAAAHDSFLGALSAVMRALNPLQGLITVPR